MQSSPRLGSEGRSRSAARLCRGAVAHPQRSASSVRPCADTRTLTFVESQAAPEIAPRLSQCSTYGLSRTAEILMRRCILHPKPTERIELKSSFLEAEVGEPVTGRITGFYECRSRGAANGALWGQLCRQAPPGALARCPGPGVRRLRLRW